MKRMHEKTITYRSYKNLNDFITRIKETRLKIVTADT